MSELRVIRDGVAVTAVDEGSGPAVLMVHGGGSDETALALVAAQLTADHRVIRLRRRLYAARPTVIPAHSMATEAADIVAIAEAAAGSTGEPIALVGHSSGAVAALEAALLTPKPFASVLAYEPPMPTRSLVGGEAARRARAAYEAGDAAEAIRIVMLDIVGFPAHIARAVLADPAGRAAMIAMTGAQLADCEALDALGVGIDRYRALDLPVTLLEGDASPPHLRDRLADLATVLPNARVVTMRGQGHLANMTSPGTFAAEIRNLAPARASLSPD